MHRLLFASLVVASAAVAQASLVTNLSPGTANYTNAGAISTNSAGSPIPTTSAVFANGNTFNVSFTPTAADLTGTVTLYELGGTANGTGMYLIDGVPTLCLKQASNDNQVPSSLNDLDLSNTGVHTLGGDQGAAAVQSGYGALQAGVHYSLAHSYAAGSSPVVQIGITSSNGEAVIQTFTLTGSDVGKNWAGDRSVSFYTQPRSVSASTGGLSGENAGNAFTGVQAKLDVEDDASPTNNVYIKSFAGTIDAPSYYWNQASTLVPEPTALLAGIASIGLVRRRRA